MFSGTGLRFEIFNFKSNIMPNEKYVENLENKILLDLPGDFDIIQIPYFPTFAHILYY